MRRDGKKAPGISGAFYLMNNDHLGAGKLFSILLQCCKINSILQAAEVS
jgi:hypothetical protein